MTNSAVLSAGATSSARSFAQQVLAIRKQILTSTGPDDLRHLRRMECWGRFCTLMGYALAPWFPNPVAAALISQGNLSRWLLMHHISHRGYDKVPQVPPRYTSQHFAHGWRRFIDWFDWILPAGWRYEHNVLHHYHTGEDRDPDLIERNLADSWISRQPLSVRYMAVALLAATWKITYYAPNTFMALENVERKKRGSPVLQNWWELFNPATCVGRTFLRRCVLPYGLMRFIVLPSLFLPFGQRAALWVLLNSILAEIITNIHSFCVIAPNHTGDDLYRFDTEQKDKTEYCARQVLGSVNYRCGSDLLDYSQMWLNYQIEHHIWPDVPMLKYQQWQPRLKALCAEHGLPYVQQNVFARVVKLVDIMVGKTRMQRTTQAASHAVTCD